MDTSDNLRMCIYVTYSGASFDIISNLRMGRENTNYKTFDSVSREQE